MSSLLTPEEKALVEREFVARQEEKSRKQRFYRWVFWLGVPSEILAALAMEVPGAGLLAIVLALAGLVCLLIYTNFLIFPTTWAKDYSVGWHLNPWRDALSRMSAEGRAKTGLVFLVAYPISRMVFSALALIWR